MPKDYQEQNLAKTARERRNQTFCLSDKSDRPTCRIQQVLFKILSQLQRTYRKVKHYLCNDAAQQNDSSHRYITNFI